MMEDILTLILLYDKNGDWHFEIGKHLWMDDVYLWNDEDHCEYKCNYLYGPPVYQES